MTPEASAGIELIRAAMKVTDIVGAEATGQSKESVDVIKFMLEVIDDQEKDIKELTAALLAAKGANA